jgi:hypothetical protein
MVRRANRRLVAGLLVVLLGIAGPGVAHGAPSLVPTPPAPVGVTTGVPFETTLLVFTDTEPGPMPDGAGWVSLLYQDLLGRPVDSPFWSDQLAAGVSRRQVADAVVRSEEWRRRTVVTWWTRYLGRVPVDLDVWSTQLAGPWSVARVRAILLASEEYRAGLPDDTAFLEVLFTEALGRPLDPGAAAWFGAALAGGLPHLTVADFVLASEEARRFRAAELVTQLLRRAPTGPEIDGIAASLGSVGEAATLVDLVTTAGYDALQPSTYTATVAVDGAAPAPARVVRRLDGSFVVVATVVVAAPGSRSAEVVVRRSTGEQLQASVPITATRARNEDYLDAVALVALGRSLAPDELAEHLSRIPAGGTRTRARVALGMVAGDEGRRRVASMLYRELLGREAAAPEAAFWAGRIAAADVQVVRALLLGSDEVHAQAGGDPAGWLDLLYRRALDRPVDQQGLAAWQALLSRGIPRVFVAYAILGSEEARRATAGWWVTELLGRTPTADETALGSFLVGIPPFELGFPALLLGGDDLYTATTGAPR